MTKSDYTELFYEIVNQQKNNPEDIKIDKKYSNLSVKKLELQEANRQYEEYFNKYHQKYRILPTESELKRYYSLFPDINKSYFYFGRDDEDLRKVGCFFLHYLPIKTYGKNHPKSKRTDYKSVFAQSLLDSKLGDGDLELPTSLQDFSSSFIIIYINSPLTQYNVAPNMLLTFATQRNTALKPVLFLSLVRIPLLESSSCLLFKSYDNRDSLPSPISTDVKPLYPSTPITTKETFKPKTSYPKTENSESSDYYASGKKNNSKLSEIKNKFGI